MIVYEWGQVSGADQGGGKCPVTLPTAGSAARLFDRQ